MNISPEEAQESLAAIQQTRTQMRKLVSLNGYFLIICGLVWFFGPLANQFLPLAYVGWVWGSLSLIGTILSGFLGYYLGTRARSTFGARVGLFFLTLGGFTGLWLIILQPLSVKQGFLFFLSSIAFGSVVAGILQRIVGSVIGGLSFIALALIGYYLLPAYFFLWVAICCGLSLAGFGLFLRLRWR